VDFTHITKKEKVSDIILLNAQNELTLYIITMINLINHETKTQQES